MIIIIIIKCAQVQFEMSWNNHSDSPKKISSGNILISFFSCFFFSQLTLGNNWKEKQWITPSKIKLMLQHIPWCYDSWNQTPPAAVYIPDHLKSYNNSNNHDCASRFMKTDTRPKTYVMPRYLSLYELNYKKVNIHTDGGVPIVGCVNSHKTHILDK